MKSTRIAVSTLLIVLAAITAACDSRSKTRQTAGLTQTRKEVSLAMQRYADAARAVDANASAAFFATEGVIFEPGISPIQSRDSIRAFIGSFPGVQVDSATMHADTIDVFDNTALVWGSYFEKLRFAGQPPSSQHGKFVMKWVMHPPRTWLIERYYRIPLPDVPATTAPVEPSRK